MRSIKGSDPDKRFATIMPTFVAEGRQHIPPVIIFRGAADELSGGKKRQSKARKIERKAYDKRVVVLFQVSATRSGAAKHQPKSFLLS